MLTDRCVSLRMILLAGMAFLGETHSLFAQSSASSTVERWIRQLEHPDFRQRNAAEESLLRHGTAGIAALERAREGGSGELRYRAERLLERLRKLSYQERAEALYVNPWRAGGEIATAWEKFHALAGDSSAAKALFISMLKADPEVTLSVVGDSRRMRMLLEQRGVELIRLAQFSQSLQSSRGKIACVLFATLCCDAPGPQAASAVNSLINTDPFKEAMRDARINTPLRGLLAHWISRPSLVSAHSRLDLAYRYELPEGVVPARELISRARGQRSPTPAAIQFLAIHGGREVIPELEELLADENGLSSSSRPVEGQTIEFNCQVRDVALLGLLIQTDQSAADYGFTALQSDGKGGFRADTIGFYSNEEREKALRRWRAWRDSNVQDRLHDWPEAVEGWAL